MQKELLKEQADRLPSLPGIYKMLDRNGSILYIGKSKCLKKRVKSYFSASPSWSKIQRLVQRIDAFAYEVTDTHLEARLLECELIKLHKPPFNAQMKNDRQYVYLQVADYNPHKPLSLVQERQDNSYGPFRHQFGLEETMNTLRNIYPLSKRNGTYEYEYHLFPVKMDKPMYGDNRLLLLELLNDTGNLDRLIRQTEEKMEEAASVCRFETAALYRDLIPGLQYIKNGIDRYTGLLEKSLVLKIPAVGGIKLIYVSKGNILQKKLVSSISPKSLQSLIHRGSLRERKQTADPLPVPFGLLTAPDALPLDEKTIMDFRDILCSEIMSLPEDMVLEL